MAESKSLKTATKEATKEAQTEARTVKTETAPVDLPTSTRRHSQPS